MRAPVRAHLGRTTRAELNPSPREGRAGKELEDLIEDLNEEGFEDPKNPTDAELEMAWRRLLLVEENFPLPDDVRYRHFLEVYKDLNNMLARGTGQ